MRARISLLSLLCLALGAWASAARAEVYQCVGPGGSLLLTDSGCPAGYQTKFVAREVQRPRPVEASAEAPPVPQSSAKSEAQRLAAAEAEAALLRVQLETERLRRELMLEQLMVADRQLEPRIDPTLGYSVVGPIVVARPLWYLPRHARHDKPGKPCVDCRPPVRDQSVEVIPRDPWRDCGMFGCTPSITHAPWDDAPRARDAGTAGRPGISGAPPRSTVSPVSARNLRP
jgi:hypothetical protein